MADTDKLYNSVAAEKARATYVKTQLDLKVNASEKGAANGVATLDESGFVPSTQLPSYVDDVIDLLAITDTAPATCAKGDLYFNTTTKKVVRATGTNTWGTSAATNTDPEKGKIYVNLSDDKTYRWSGSTMVATPSSDFTGIKVGSSGSTITPSQGVIELPAYEAGAQVNPSVMGASGSTHASGLVPDTPTTAGTTKFLREDGTWQTPEGGATYVPTLNSAPTSSTTTYTKDGQTVDFEVGQFARVADASAEEGYVFYQLYDLATSGGVTTAKWKSDVIPTPDEEDLTIVNNAIKFKDRPNTDGMGRKILRKNMVSGVNTLTQSMMQTTNTIYVIQYDFTLGEDITMPANCVLEFDGGSINGNSWKKAIICNNTVIKADRKQIVSNCFFSGDFHCELCPQWFGAKGDGVTDDQNAFYLLMYSANTKEGCNVYIPAGTYIIRSSTDIFTKDIHMYGDGEDSKIIFDGVGGFTFEKREDLFTSDSAITLQCTITEDVNAGSYVLKLDSTSGLSADDWICICDSVDDSYFYKVDRTPQYRQSEFAEIKSIDSESNEVTLKNPLFGDYYVEWGGKSSSITGVTHRTVISRIRSINVILENLSLERPMNTSARELVCLTHAKNSIIKNVRTKSYGVQAGIRILQCYFTDIVGCSADNGINTHPDYSSEHSSYGIAVSNSQDCKVDRCDAISTGHAFTTGGGGGLTSIINRHIVYTNCIGRGYGGNTTSVAFDSHGDCDFVNFVDCISYTSLQFSGRTAEVSGCLIHGDLNTFEVSGMNISIRDNNVLGTINATLYFDEGSGRETNGIMSITNNKCGSILVNPQGSTASFENAKLVISNNILNEDGIFRIAAYLSSYCWKDIVVSGNQMTGCPIRLQQPTTTIQSYETNFIVRDNLCLGIHLENGNPSALNTIADIANNTIINSDWNHSLALYNVKNVTISGNIIRILRYDYIGVVTMVEKLFLMNNISSSGKKFYIPNINPNISIYEKGNIVLDRGTAKIIKLMPDSLPSTANYINFDKTEYSTSERVAISDSLYLNNQNGFKIFDTDLRKNVIYDKRSCRWITENGNVAINDIGKTEDRPDGVCINREGSERPAASHVFIGKSFKRTEDSKYYIVTAINGENVTWTAESEVAGKTISADVVRAAPLESGYPSGEEIYVGFVVFNTSAFVFYKALSIDENNVVTWVPVIFTNHLIRAKDAGFLYYDTTLNKQLHASQIESTGDFKWLEEDGAKAGVLRSGVFADRPAAADIYVGFKYFCTNRQTTEGATDGIEIIHKGNNVWADALGRVVS